MSLFQTVTGQKRPPHPNEHTEEYVGKQPKQQAMRLHVVMRGIWMKRIAQYYHQCVHRQRLSLEECYCTCLFMLECAGAHCVGVASALFLEQLQGVKVVGGEDRDAEEDAVLDGGED